MPVSCSVFRPTAVKAVLFSALVLAQIVQPAHSGDFGGYIKVHTHPPAEGSQPRSSEMYQQCTQAIEASNIGCIEKAKLIKAILIPQPKTFQGSNQRQLLIQAVTNFRAHQAKQEVIYNGCQTAFDVCTKTCTEALDDLETWNWQIQNEIDTKRAATGQEDPKLRAEHKATEKNTDHAWKMRYSCTKNYGSAAANSKALMMATETKITQTQATIQQLDRLPASQKSGTAGGGQKGSPLDGLQRIEIKPKESRAGGSIRG